MRGNGRRAWVVRGLGLATFTTLIGASTGITGKGTIGTQALITEPGTYTVGQDIDLSGANLGAGTPVINVVLMNGGEVVLDLDNHTITRGAGGPVIAISCGTGGNEGSAGCAVTVRDGKLASGSVNVRAVDTDLRLERITAVGANQDGIQVTRGSLSVVSSVIRGAGGNGIWGDSSTCGVDDSVIANPGLSGIALQEATQMELTNTVIRGAGAHGVSFIDLTDSPNDPTSFTDVRVVGSAQDGIHVEGNIPLTITGGVVRGSGGHGVIVGNNEHPVRITGTKIVDTVGPAAILFSGAGGSVVVADTQIRDFAGAGVVSSDSRPGSSLLLERNLIATAGTTVDVYPYIGGQTEGVGMVRIVDNTIENVGTGLRVTTPGALITGNQLRMMARDGIVVGGRSPVVRDNIVAGSGVGLGIGLGSYTAEGGGLGLLSEGGTNDVRALVDGNQVRGFDHGLHFAPGTTVDANGYYRANTLVGNVTAVVGGYDAGGNIL